MNTQYTNQNTEKISNTQSRIFNAGIGYWIFGIFSGFGFGRWVFVSIFLFFILVISSTAYAAEWPGLVPACGKTPEAVTDTTTGATTRVYTPCSTCDFAVLVKTVLDFVWYYVALAGVALMLMVGGFRMVTGAIGGSATAHQKGLATIKNAFIGLAIVLFAWLAVDTVIKFIAQQSLTSGSPAKLPKRIDSGLQEGPLGVIAPASVEYGPWNEIKCTGLDPIKVVTKPLPPPSKIPPPIPGPPGPPSGATQQDIPSEYKTAAEEARSFATLQGGGSCGANGKKISPQQNISEAAAGKQITYCSTGCTATQGCGGIGGGGFVTPNLAMLRGFQGIYNQCGNYTVISIAGGAEHVKNSRHYQGRAIDIQLKKPKGSAWTDCLNNIRATLGGIDASPTAGTFCDQGGRAVDCASASHIHVSFTP